MANNNDKCIHPITSAVISILQQSEICSLIDSGQESKIEISRPILHKSDKKNINLINRTNCVINGSNKSFNHILSQSSEVSRLYRTDILNGIHRNVDLKNGKEYYFEERCFTVVDGMDGIWIVSVRDCCSASLIPTIVDYDQSYIYSVTVHDINKYNPVSLRETTINDASRYDIFCTINIDELEGYLDDNFKNLTSTIETIDQKYRSILSEQD
jgi:hypothetical protein